MDFARLMGPSSGRYVIQRPAAVSGALARPSGGRNRVAGLGTLDHAGMVLRSLAGPEALGSYIEQEWPLQVGPWSASTCRYTFSR